MVANTFLLHASYICFLVLADFARSLKDAKKSSVFVEDVKEEGL